MNWNQDINNFKKLVHDIHDELIMLIYILGSTTVIILILLLLIPLLLNFSLFIPHHFQDINMANQYYSTITDILGILAAIVGVILGLFYYYNRLEYDKTTLKNNHTMMRTQLYLDELKALDKYVMSILCRTYNGNAGLSSCRQEITGSMFEIYLLLEVDCCKNGPMDSRDFKIFNDVLSYVDQDDILMLHTHRTIQSIDDETLELTKSSYTEKYHDARKLCHLKCIK